jgi:hypothetical protein
LGLFHKAPTAKLSFVCIGMPLLNYFVLVEVSKTGVEQLC